MMLRTIAWCCLAVASPLAAAHAESPSRDVVVRNTRAEPVPATIVGTTPISGAVTVANTPDVRVAAPVSVLDAPARGLHFEYLDCVFDAATIGGRLCTATLSVPAGKRFVVKSASFFLPFPGATAMAEVTGWTASGLPNTFTAPIATAQPLNGYLRGHYEMTLYADPQRNGGDGLRVQCTTTADASPRTCNVQLYGYYVDCTAASCAEF